MQSVYNVNQNIDKCNYVENDGLLLTDKDIISCQTFPQDYDFMDQSVQYICGMSVPPVMMAKISEQVYRQWLKGGDAD